MNLVWIRGQGPATTSALADEIEQEGALYTGLCCTLGRHRCLWGVINDWTPADRNRELAKGDRSELYKRGLSIADNESFVGNPEERCIEMAQRLRAIP